MNKRQEEILQLAQHQGFVSIEALAQAFCVTTQTIRRDINELCNQQLLTRYHGGAAPASSVENVDYSARKVLCLDEKRRIAALLASHIPDRASLFINLGTTTEEIAKALLDHVGLRVITNNLNVAAALCDNPSFEVIIAGGVVRQRDRGITGEATIDFIRQFKVDFGIIGISSIDEDGALLDFDYREVRVAQAIIENSRQLLLAADHSKFGRSALVRLGHLSQVDALYTDQMPSSAITAILDENHAALHLAGPAP
ncbi:DeoR family transcriptional regulator [Geothermobacter hydrogeniphilus]|uniref:DeoR family transcriptional regulator n=1 Tax=Geothermobacter hydrogeniphilus TaxID=1969733 RepID=A0A1X0YBA9_9BACT|nr:DeoR family transcriptional regulator [Geothermobacter hydrogeniphilus]ORJ62392.1 DeoR family transcriptional regulator [Geothermobacter hydrogeniphilus]